MQLTKLKIYYCLSLATQLVLRWGWIFLAWHVFYVLLNLSEKVPLEIELYFLMIYPGLMVFFLSLFCYRSYRTLRAFDRKIENTFSMQFKWVNLRHEYADRPLPENRVESLLGGTAFRDFFGGQRLFSMGKWTLMVLGLILMFHLAFWNLQSRFVINLKSIVSPPSISVEVHYPSFVKEGDDFKVSFSGDMERAFLSLHSGERTVNELVSQGDEIVLTNVVSSIFGEMIFKEGRFYGCEVDSASFCVQARCKGFDH